MTDSWSGLIQIASIDILLGGDNAIVIALACQGLPEKERRAAMAWGVIGAIGVRLVLLFFALALLRLPYVKLIAALFLFWIGINLLGGKSHQKEGRRNETFFSSIRTIILADTVMSIDNIIGVAGAARGDFLLVILGLSVSVPIILWGSRFVLKTMDRFPSLILMGAGLIGWIAGGMFFSDESLAKIGSSLSWAGPAGFALATVLIGKWRGGGREMREIADYGKEER